MSNTKVFNELSNHDKAAYGAVFGALVGDAAGATLEFLRRQLLTPVEN